MGNINPRSNMEFGVRGVAGASGVPTVSERQTFSPPPEAPPAPVISNTPAPAPVVPAPVAPTVMVVAPVAPQTHTPKHTVTNQNLVHSLGGSAAGRTATFKRRMGGRNVATVTVQVSPGGGAQRLSTVAIWHDANGVEHIHHNGQMRKVTDLNLNIVRRETVTRG